MAAAHREGGGALEGAESRALPVAVLCGRPNVGKSTLFNAIARRRIAIEEATAGVTRDRVSARVVTGTRAIELVDTGGIGGSPRGTLQDEIARQIAIALKSADVVLLVVDAREGCTEADREIAGRVRALAKPILLLVNKAESPRLVQEAVEFWDLGVGEPLAVSARDRSGIRGALERLAGIVPPCGTDLPTEGREAMRLAIVGRVNAGKSTLLNQLAGEERCIVSSLPGTTRDAVDVLIRRGERLFWAIDTAGIRKRRSVDGSLEYYSQQRAVESIRRADVVLFLLDVTQEVTRVDRQIVALVLEQSKPAVVALNKWDLAPGRSLRSFRRYFEEALPGLAFAPRVFVSAWRGKNLESLLETASILHGQAARRVSTPDVNRTLQEAAEALGRLGRGRRRPRTFYGTQVGVRPPTFAVFVNDTRLFSAASLRYLEARFRESLGFPLLPLRILLRSRDARVGRTGRARGRTGGPAPGARRRGAGRGKGARRTGA